MDIIRGGSVILKVRPDSNDKCTKKVMGENTVSLTARLSSAFSFQVGDYLMFAGEKYTLNILPKVEKASEHQYVYDLVFEGIEYELRKVHMLFYTANLVYAGGADFSLMGNAELQARVIVENLNRVQSGWTLGEVINSEAKNLTYSNNNCLEAINRIAEEFGTEFWIGSDKTINIGKRGDILPVTFKYGKNKGLYSIERTNVNSKDIVTRLYPFGSEQNLPKGYRNNSKRLQIEGAYIENNTSLYGIIESSQTFEEIKPERTGTITAVNGGDVLEFTDSSMDFDLNEADQNGTLYLIPGTTPKIHFQDGDLAGYEFELASYNHTSKTFRVKKFTNEIAYDLPNGTLKPRVGDKYIILDIYMPQSYVTDAEARLLAKAQESLAQNSVPNVAYKVEADPLFIKKLGIGYKVGDYVHVEDGDIGIDRDIRLVGIDRKLVNTDDYDFELADSVEPTLVSQILTSLERTDIVLQMNRLNDPARARRNYKVVQELQNAIYDQDGYFDNGNIKPFSIETSMLSVGSKGQQFYTDCMFQTNYLGNKNSLVVGNGALSHFTIESEIRNWTITGLSETLPDDNLRYIFIKCLKAGSTGQVVLSANQLAIDDGMYYNFFAGVLSSVIDNARQVSLLFGFTTINGRFIKTGRIQSADGSTYFDLDTSVIAGKITFIAGSSGYANLTDKPDLSVYSLQADVNALVSNLQSQIDGQIMTWFDNYVPTLSNAPATSWATDAEKDKHLGDLFYNKSTGLGYRFSKTGSVYSWEILKDTDVALALANAAAAQDTADGKRRVFVAQPTTPYEIGDLWSQGTTGDLMKCKVTRLTGSYTAADWEKASKYTDDTTALIALQDADEALTNAANAQTAANNANSLLADIASDSKLTPVEKSSVRAEWDIIAAEKTVNDAQADTFGITTEKTTYGTKFQALATYLNNGTTWGSGVPSWIADANLGATTNIVGATFRLTFKEYYDARTALLNAIAVKAKQLADAAQDTVDNLEIGGRNLVLNSESYELNNYSGSFLTKTQNYSVSEWSTSKAVRHQTTGGTNVRKALKTLMVSQSSTLYSWGFYFKNLGSNILTINSNLGGILKSINPGEATVIKFENITGDGTTGIQIQVRTSTVYESTDFALWRVKLETGSRCTDWTPAPEDVEKGILDAQTAATTAQTGVNALDYLKTAMQGSTDITGGLLATNVLLMKTLAGVITAGLSGLSNDNIAFWGGGTYQDALDAIAKIILRKDGSGQFAGGKILFTNDGDLSVGALGIDANGNLIIKDSGSVNRVLLTKNDITTLSAIESSTQNTTVNNAYNEYTGEGTQTYNLANTLTVNNNNSQVTVVCNLNSSITDNTLEGDSEASAYIQLLLVNTVSGASIQIDSLSTHRYSSDVNNSKSVNKSVVVPAGTYQLRVSYTHTDYGNCSFASYISASTTTVFYDGAVQRTELGKNGFGIIGSALNYSFFGMEGGVFKAVEKVSSSGVYDKPGVLASASVSSTGTSTKKWGAKTGNSTKPSAGTYTISHTIGHTDYTVQITPLTSARVGYISAKNSTSVTIVMTNMSGTATDTAFDYLITGNNQATT